MRRPPKLVPVIVAAAGALALTVGVVAAINGRLAGILIALGGAALLAWSLRVTRRG